MSETNLREEEERRRREAAGESPALRDPRVDQFFSSLEQNAATTAARETAAELTPTQIPDSPDPRVQNFFQTLSAQQQAQTAARLQPQPQEPTSRGIFGEFGSGFARGVRGAGRDIRAGLALAGDAVGGQDDAIETLRRLQQSSENETRKAVEFDDAFDNVGNFTLWAAATLGEQVPNVAAIIAGGGVGTIAGRLVARRAITTATAQAISRRFGVAGAFSTAAAIETGGTGQELFGATGEARPNEALLAGAAKASLEIITPVAVARRFGILPRHVDGVISRAFRELDNVKSPAVRAGLAAIGTGATEGVTETVQEAIDIATRAYVDENYDILGPESAARLKEAAVTGAFVGGVFGGASGAFARGQTEGERQQGAEPAVVQPGQPGTAPVEPQAPTVPESARAETFAVPSEDGTSLTFQPGLDLVRQGLPEDARPFRATEDLAGADVTATARDLPDEVTATTEGVEFLDQTRAGEAIELVGRALKAREAGDLVSAQRFLSDAEGIGFRLRTGLQSGFTVRGDAVVEQFRNVLEETDIDSVPITIDQTETLRRVTPGSSFPHAGVPHGNLDVGQIHPLGDLTTDFKNPPPVREVGAPREFLVDVRRLDPRRVTLSNRHEIAKTIGFNLLSSQEATVDFIDRLEELRDQGVLDYDIGALHEIYDALREGSSANIITLIGDEKFRISPEALDVPLSKSSAIYIGELPQAALFEVPNIVDSHSRGVNAFRNFEPSRPNIHRAIFENGKTVRLVNATTGAKIQAEDRGAIRIAREGKRPRKVTRRVEQQMTAFANAMIKKLRLDEGGDAPIIYVTSDPGLHAKLTGQSRDTFNKNLGGQIAYFPNGASIYVRPSQTGLASIETFAHEFGHFIHRWSLSRAPAAIQHQLLNAYNRALMKAHFGNANTFATSFLAPERFARGFTETDVTIPFSGTQFAENADYWASFDEWFADQVAKWVLGGPGRSPIDSVERFMQKVAARLKEYWSRWIKLDNVDIPTVNDAVSRYMDWLQTRPEEVQRSNTSEHKSVLPATSPSRTGPDWALGQYIPEQPETEKIDRFLNSSMANSAMTKETKTKAKDMSERARYFNWLAKFGYSVYQLAQLNPGLDFLQRYRQILDLWSNKKARLQASADDTLRVWNTLTGQQIDSLAELLFAVDSMDYRSKEEVENGTVRLPTEQELAALVTKFKIDKQTFGVYERIRQDFVNVLDDIETVLIRDIEKMGLDFATAEIKQAEIKKEFRAIRNRPYFPHMRFGRFMLSVRDKDGNVVWVQAFETQKEAERAQKGIHKEYPIDEGFKAGLGTLSEEATVFRGLPPSLLTMIRTRLDLSAEQNAAIDELLVEMAPAQSFRKQFARRKNVAGFSRDAMRSYAAYMWHGANHLARIEYGQQLRDAIADGRKFAQQLQREGENAIKETEIANYLSDHVDHVLNPRPDWAALRSIAFQWWLGFSPAAAALNFTQLPLVAAPFMSKKFGTGKALNALRKGMLNVRRKYANPEKFVEGLSESDRKIFEVAFDQQFLRESMAKELAAVAEGGNLLKLAPTSGVRRGLTGLAHASGFMFQTSEQINRIVTFYSALELARNNPDTEYMQSVVKDNQIELRNLVDRQGLTELEAAQFLAAKDTVRATMFNYAAHARPRFMRGKIQTLFTFYTFLQNMLFFTVHQDASKRMLLVLLLMAGPMGLPGAEDIDELVRFASQKMFGKDISPERMLRETLAEVVDNPDVYMYGAGRAGFGLPAMADFVGLPAPRFDMSASVSMGQIVPGMRDLGTPGVDFDERLSRATTDIAGASYGIGLDLLKFMSDSQLPIDDAKRWERAMPRSLRAAARARRFYTEGRERSRTGATVLEFNTSNPQDLAEIAFQGLGFTPTRLSRQYSLQNEIFEAEQYWATRRQMLMRQFDIAKQRGGGDAVTEVHKAIREYNQTVPVPSLRITGKQLRQSFKTRLRNRRLQERGISRRRIFRPLGQEIRQQFPEVGGTQPAALPSPDEIKNPETVVEIEDVDF